MPCGLDNVIVTSDESTWRTGERNAGAGSWGTLKNEMKGKRCKTGEYGGGKKTKKATFLRDKNWKSRAYLQVRAVR